MDILEISVIVVTMISVFLTGSKNSWTWLFAILANVIWLIVGLQRSITVIIICSCIYLVLSFRGAYLWIFKSNKGGHIAKVLFLILSLISFNADMLLAQDDKAIQDIREKCGAIDTFKSYRKVEIDVLDESTEGGVVVGYFDGNEIKKIVGRFYGETGQEIEEYYLWKGRLLFILSRTSYYKYPINYEHEPLGEVSRVEEERYYFRDNKMIQWIRANGEVASENDPEYQSRERAWVKESEKLIRELERSSN